MISNYVASQSFLRSLTPIYLPLHAIISRSFVYLHYHTSVVMMVMIALKHYEEGVCYVTRSPRTSNLHPQNVKV
jgi:hypothetical protein